MESQLTDQQAELLQNILDHAFRELRSEVVATDNPAFKHELREREGVLREMLDLVGGPLPNLS